jgi:hypothetical protein
MITHDPKIEYVKKIKDFPTYHITSNGDVYSTDHNRLTKLKPSLSGVHRRQYYQVSLIKEDKRFQKKIHKLVAQAFYNYETSNRKIVIDHIDENQLNNNISNLQIITNRKNSSKAYALKRSLPTGVYQERKKFRARIKINGKSKNLGTFPTAEIAAHAYQTELKKINLLVKKYPLDLTNSIQLHYWNPHQQDYNQLDLFKKKTFFQNINFRITKFLNSLFK